MRRSPVNMNENRIVVSPELTSTLSLQVFGANKDVGKTVITAGLLRAAALQVGVSP